MKQIINIIILSIFFTVTALSAIGVYAYDIDYGDAVGYGEASSLKATYQRLGYINGVDDGVSWSVNGSDFGTTADLIIGQEVTFQFNFWQGNNYRQPDSYDQLHAVFDWNQDFYWDDSEVIIYEQIDTLAYGLPIDDFSMARYITFETSFLVPDTMSVGSTWLRSRVHCLHTPYPDLIPYGFLNQGETEDYKLSIAQAPVPEPSTIILLFAGLVILACINRKKPLKKA